MALNVGSLVAKLGIDPAQFTKGLQDAEGNVESFKENTGRLFAAAGIAAGLAFGAAVIGGLSQEAVGDKIAAQLGQSAERGKEFGEIAGDLYAEGWGESVQAVGDAIMAVQKMHLVNEDATAGEIKEIARQATILSDVFGQDVAGSTRAVQQLIKNGLVPDAVTGFDLITRGIQEGVDKSDDLLDTFNEYSTQFRDLGLNGQQALGLLSQGLKGGARDADTVADALKEFAIRAQDGSKTSIDGFKAIGLNGKEMTKVFAAGGPAAAAGLDTVLDRLRGMKDPVARNAAAVALFGTKAEDLQDSLFKLDLTTATTGFDNLAGATARAGETASGNAAANLETFKRKALDKLVDVLGGTVIPMLDKLITALSGLGGWWKKNQEWAAPFAVFLGTFGGIILTIVAAMKIWTMITAAYTVVQWALNTAMLANPLGLVIIAIVALVAALIYAWNHSETFRKILIGAWEGIKAAALAVWDWMKNSLWPGIKAVWNQLIASIMWVVNGWQSAWSKITAAAAWVRDTLRSIFNAVGDFIGAAFRRGESAARSAVNGLIGLVNQAISGVNRLIRGANNLPGVNIPQIGSVPRLAVGGAVQPRPGGTAVVMGDGGEVEYGVPKSDMREIIGQAVVAAGGSGGGVLTVVIKGDGMLRAIRGTTRVRGGSAQTVLVGA